MLLLFLPPFKDFMTSLVIQFGGPGPGMTVDRSVVVFAMALGFMSVVMLQSIATIVPTENKKTWISQAFAAGQREIEVGSFVPPTLLPQLADTAELLAYAKTLPGLFASVLVPNLKGAERALEAGADLMILPLSASHAHSLANLRKTPDEVVAEMRRIRAARDSSGAKTLIEGGVGTMVSPLISVTR